MVTVVSKKTMTQTLQRQQRRTRSLHTQLSGTILLTLTAGLGLMLVIAGAQMSSMSYESFSNEQQNLALIIANTLNQTVDNAGPNGAAPSNGGPSNGPPDTRLDNSGLQIDQQQALAQVAQQNGILSIFDRNGNRLAPTTNIPILSPVLPELIAALHGEIGNQTYNGHLYIAVPIIHDGSRILGAVWLDSALDAVTDNLRREWMILLGAALGTLTLTALTAWYLAGRIVRPLSELGIAARQMAEGQLTTRVAETSTVTELAALGSVFNHMAAQIENTVARQREFVANASHELRAPLASIRLRAEMLAGGALNTDDTSHYATEIDSEAKQLGQLVAELLQLARAEDETFRPPAEPIASADVLADCLRPIRLRAARKSQQLQVEIAPDLPDVRMAPGDLRSMIGNLLDNAVKYTPEGGHISLKAYSDPGHKQWIIEVRDTGIGIPPNDLGRVTERFFRVDRAHTRQVPGTGLGLALVQALARRYGGTLEIESSGIPGEGTCSRLRLNVP